MFEGSPEEVLNPAQGISGYWIDIVAFLDGLDCGRRATHASAVERKKKPAMDDLALQKWMQQFDSEIAISTAVDAREQQPLEARPGTPSDFASALRTSGHSGRRLIIHRRAFHAP